MSKNENPRPTFYKVFKNGLKRVYILLVEYYKKGLNGSNEASSIYYKNVNMKNDTVKYMRPFFSSWILYFFLYFSEKNRKCYLGKNKIFGRGVSYTKSKKDIFKNVLL